MDECNTLLSAYVNALRIVLHSPIDMGVLRGSVEKYRTRDLEVPVSCLTGRSLGFFVRDVPGQDTSEPKPSACEAQGMYGYVSSHPDITEIMLKVATFPINNFLFDVEAVSNINLSVYNTIAAARAPIRALLEFL